MRRPDPRPLRAVAALAVGLLLLATTQVWFVVRRPAAPGLPVLPVEHRPGSLGWVAAVSLVAGLCLLGSLARPWPWQRVLALLACAAALLGVVLAGLEVRTLTTADGGVSVEPWYVVALLCAAAAVVLAGLAELGRVRPRAVDPVPGAVDPAEEARRAGEAAWRSLSEGRDPTLGP